MIKPKIILLFLLITFAAFPQKKTVSNNPNVKPSKQETQEWISQKIKIYSYEGQHSKEIYNISFEKEDVIIEHNAWAEIFNTTIKCVVKIHIADIEYISFKEYETNLWMSINLIKGKELFSICDNGKSTSDSITYILLDKTFKNDDLPERMNKAFKRLVELYGGKKATNKEVF